MIGGTGEQDLVVAGVARDGTLSGDNCERNKQLKGKICEIMIETGFFLGNVENCVSTADSVVRAVKEPGI